MVNCWVNQLTCLTLSMAIFLREFTKLLLPVAQLLRLQGVPVYMEYMLCPPYRHGCILKSSVLQNLGCLVNFIRSELVPIQYLKTEAVLFVCMSVCFCPTSSLIVCLMCDNSGSCAHQQGMQGKIVHTDPIDTSSWSFVTGGALCITLVPVYLPGSCSIQAYALLQVGKTLVTEWAIKSQLLVTVFPRQEAACFCVTFAGPEGQMLWCNVGPVLHDWDGVCRPIVQDAPSCIQEDPQFPQPDRDPYSPMSDFSITDDRATEAVSVFSHATRRSATSLLWRLVSRRRHQDQSLPAF